MLAKKYKSEVISIDNPCQGIYQLEFTPMRGRYKYLPGQFLHLAMNDEYEGIGQWPESRCFSMQSNPSEATICITYAVKGDFTKEMKQSLKVGSEVWIKLPYGDLFTQPHSKENTVFIAGGTGITPFLSLFTHDTFKEYSNPQIYLGFRNKEYNIYEKELSSVQTCEAKIFYEDTDGNLDISRIFSENGSICDYFISGPPAMIKVFKQTLIEKGISGENILADDWE